jgi:hypothetical protein
MMCESVAPPFLTFALDGDESASCPYCLLLGNSPQYSLYRRLAGRTPEHLDIMEKSVLPLPGTEPWLLSHPACSLVTILTELSNLQVFIWQEFKYTKEKLLTHHNRRDSNKITKTCSLAQSKRILMDCEACGGQREKTVLCIMIFHILKRSQKASS